MTKETHILVRVAVGDPDPKPQADQKVKMQNSDSVVAGTDFQVKEEDTETGPLETTC